MPHLLALPLAMASGFSSSLGQVRDFAELDSRVNGGNGEFQWIVINFSFDSPRH